MTKTETIKRGQFLKFDEDLTPDEVSKLGDRLEFHLGFMAINMAAGRDKYIKSSAQSILEIAQAMKAKGDYQL